MTARRRIAAVLLGGAALAAVSPTVAGAHVHADADSTAAGSTSVVTFAFSHGCEGAPTTKVAIKIPAGIDSVAPTAKPGWAVQTVRAAERVDQVVFAAATPLPDGMRDTVSIAVKLPADAAGSTLAFPVVQSCTVGENAWIQVPRPGQDPEALEAPAPTLTVTAVEEAGADHAHGQAHENGDPVSGAVAHTDTGESAPAPTASTASAAMVTPLGLVGVVAGLAGLATGVTALVQVRRRA